MHVSCQVYSLSGLFSNPHSAHIFVYYLIRNIQVLLLIHNTDTRGEDDTWGEDDTRGEDDAASSILQTFIKNSTSELLLLPLLTRDVVSWEGEVTAARYSDPVLAEHGAFLYLVDVTPDVPTCGKR